MNYSILYKSVTPIQLVGYMDFDWVRYKADRLSTFGFVFSLGNGAISWSSKMQPIVAFFSTEAKSRGAVVAPYETVWIKRILKDLDVSINDPIFLYYDNLTSIHLAWTKHIEVHYHFIRECVLARDIYLQHINTNLQTTDIFTKALGTDKLRQFSTNLGLSTYDLPSLRGSDSQLYS